MNKEQKVLIRRAIDRKMVNLKDRQTNVGFCQDAVRDGLDACQKLLAEIDVLMEGLEVKK